MENTQTHDRNHYSNILINHIKEISQSPENWSKMLEFSGRFYKGYTFDQQLLIHKQNPNATIVATYAQWNKLAGRASRRGSKAIRILDNSNAKSGLKYVFDIEDTAPSRNSPPKPSLWTLNDDNRSYIEQATGLKLDAEGIKKLAESLVKEQTAEQTDNTKLIQQSLAYFLASRLNVELSEQTEYDFAGIKFLTPREINSLGNTIRELAKPILLDIEKQAQNYNKEILNERNWTTIQANGRLSNPQHNHIGSGSEPASLDQMGKDEAELSSKPQQPIDERPTARGQALSALPRNGNPSRGEVPDANDATSTIEQDNREPKSDRPAEMGEGDEPNQPASGGNSQKGDNLRLESFDEIPSEIEQLGRLNSHITIQGNQEPIAEDIALANDFIQRAEQRALTQRSTSNSLTSSITSDEIDTILKDGGNNKSSILRITAHFAKDLPLQANADYLRDEYLKGRYKAGTPHDGGKGFKNPCSKNLTICRYIPYKEK